MDGIILVDKPVGPTSAELVRAVKRFVRPERVGHLGTLDPFASGLLPIMIGEGTKLAPFIADGPKVYQGIIALGSETDTLDSTGTVIRSADPPELTVAALSEAAARFTGRLEQIPSVFSAIKRDGVPLYKLARRGDEVEPPAPRQVEIHELKLESDGLSALRFTVSCSTGTYVRSLARDLGLALGTVAHLSELRRLRSGNFMLEQALPLAEVLSALELGHSANMVIDLREALTYMPEVVVEGATERRLRNGDSRALDFLAPPGATVFKVISNDHLLAVAEAVSRVTSRVLRGFNHP
jgi:tRNA pseudouridine55 synthase